MNVGRFEVTEHSSLRITAVVPAYNASKTLSLCVEALRASYEKIEDVIVFDDASTDETGRIAESLQVTLLRNFSVPVGPAAGRNAGARLCRTELVLFVDADVMVQPLAIQRLRSVFLSPDVVAAFGSYDDNPPATTVAGLYANLRHHFFHQMSPTEGQTFWAGLGMVRRKTFEESGGFADQYRWPSIEDVELGSRLARFGRIRIVPDALATHLKEWRILQLWRSDIFARAVPWAVLIASGKISAAELNTSRGEKINALLAWTLFLFIIISLWWGLAWIGALIVLATYLLRIRLLLSCLSRRIKGWRFFAAIFLHWLYHLYSSTSFALVCACRVGAQLGAQVGKRLLKGN